VLTLPLRSQGKPRLKQNVRGTPAARRERGELSFAPAPVLQAAAGGLSNNRWST